MFGKSDGLARKFTLGREVTLFESVALAFYIVGVDKGLQYMIT